MALKELMIRLKNRASDTPDTPEKNMGYQLKPSVYAGCTPDTPDTSCFDDAREKSQVQRSCSAANDAATDPNAWRELAPAYHGHHFRCPLCKVAGRGAEYGLRCGAGAALWWAYQGAV